jgi:LmbE family N-acetylglucosaminyl deacetylase
VSKRALRLLFTVLLIAAPRLSAQGRGAAALGETIEGLGTTARVLMIGAHPDDEDTQLISWLATGRHVETAYLSLTRGDGGQNLIGNELGEGLGMIRTEELLAARRLDGGRQYFTRAFDFGFSKTLDETLQHWPKDSILEDAVAIVRAFRPQVIIAVFTGTPADGHGHHQFSGVIAREVFDAAADTLRFPPSRLGGLKPWTPLKFYRLTRGGGGTLNFNVGEYDPLLGETYSQIATVSRSQHRSQGQGALPQGGPRYSGVRLELSRVSEVKAPERGLFDGIDTSWARFKSVAVADSVRAAIDSLVPAQMAIARATNPMDPSKVVAPLAAYVRLATRAAGGVTCNPLESVPIEQLNLLSVQDDIARAETCPGAMGDLALALRLTRERAASALLDAAGVSVEATAPRELIAERDTLPVTIAVYDQGKAPIVLERASISTQRGAEARPTRTIQPDSVVRQTLSYHAASRPMLPWWLSHPRRGDTFVLPSGASYVAPQMVTGEDRLENSGVDVVLRIADVDVPVHTGPIVYRFADPARGEVRRPIAVVPEITVLLQHEVEYARANALLDRTMIVTVQSAATGPRDVDVSLALPTGLKADSAVRRVSLKPFGAATLYFRVQGRLAAGRHQIKATATTGDETFDLGFVPIEYEHIRPQRLYRQSVVHLEAVNATFANLRVGYIRGVGDNVMPMLEELGLPVTELDPVALPHIDLSSYTTIVLGTRAYEASPALVANNPVLMRFVRNGGTLVAQYGQSEYAQPGILPYPITLSRPADRVTDEHAAVRVIDPSSPLLSAPNKIGESDFANWVQERALYMPHTFDAQYHALFSMNDPNEPPNDAALLVASMGKGTYIYTTFSFFRQLPAGNPGAARLFINLLSADRRATIRPATTSNPIRP